MAQAAVVAEGLALAGGSFRGRGLICHTEMVVQSFFRLIATALLIVLTAGVTASAGPSRPVC